MYEVRIITEPYKQLPCSKRNWEPGTINSQMKALSGWTTVENTLQELRWRIQMFLHGTIIEHLEGDEAHAKAKAWFDHPRNIIAYHDEPCGVDRTMRPEAPGWHQGYCNLDALTATLEREGTLFIPFRAAYDSRQYLSNMDGCGMHITFIPDHFTQVNEKVKEDGETWTRYDGFDGRYTVCITVYPSGYRYIQIFTRRDTPHPSANRFAPEMYVVEDDTTPVDVRLDLTSEAKRFVKEEAWEQIKAEVDMGLTAAKEIKRRFM